MPSWNKRNGQRATVKRPGTKEYRADYKNKNDQFYAKHTTGGCLSCGSKYVYAIGGNGRIFIYCQNCNKQLKVLNTKPTKVGNWSETHKYRQRAGLCSNCGYGRYEGTMHITSNGKKFDLQIRCSNCGARCEWHNL